MPKNINEHDARLIVLGQIDIVRERLDALEASLINLPVGDQNYVSEATNDAIGNLSLQTGVLIGVVSRYQDSAT